MKAEDYGKLRHFEKIIDQTFDTIQSLKKLNTILIFENEDINKKNVLKTIKSLEVYLEDNRDAYHKLLEIIADEDKI